MHCGIPCKVKYILPYLKPVPKLNNLSPKATMRLKWLDYINSGHCVLQASRHFDIPEPTIRFWYHRFNPNDLSSLEDKSTKPFKLRTSVVSQNIKAEVIAMRRSYPGWGKVVIQKLLMTKGINIGQSRIQLFINEAGLKRLPAKRKRSRRVNRIHMYSVPEEVLKIPGGLVYMDVKHLCLPGGTKIYQFTAIDHATRVLKLKVFSNITSTCCARFLKIIQEQFPFKEIKYIGTDNGSEFLGKCEEYLNKKGIKHVFSNPRSPKQNPYVERVIRTVIDDVYYFRGVEINQVTQQKILEEYENKYNFIRPHSSLNYLTPMETYAKLNSN